MTFSIKTKQKQTNKHYKKQNAYGKTQQKHQGLTLILIDKYF